MIAVSAENRRAFGRRRPALSSTASAALDPARSPPHGPSAARPVEPSRAAREPRARARERAPGTQVLAVVKANAYGHGLAARAAGAGGRRRPGAGRARCRDRLARAAVHAPHPAARRLLRARRAARDRRSAGWRLSCTTNEQLRMLERARARAADRSVRQDQHRDEPPRVSARATSPRCASASTTAPSVAVLRLMTHFARADEDDGIDEPLAVFNAACRGMPYPRSLANSAGVVRYRRNRRRDRAPGHHALRRVAVPLRHGGHARRAAGDDAALARSSPCRTSKANDSVGYGGTYTATRAHRIGVVACGYADGYPRHAPYGTPVLVLRQEGAHRRPRVDGHDHRRPHRVPGGARRQSRGAVGRGPAGRRRRAPPRPPSATSSCAPSRRACRSSSANVGASTSNSDAGPHMQHERVHRRHRRRRIHRRQSRQGAQRARRDATSSPSTTSRAPTSSRNLVDCEIARLPRQGRVPRAPRATATSTTTSPRCCTRARAPTRWRPTAAT